MTTLYSHPNTISSSFFLEPIWFKFIQVITLSLLSVNYWVTVMSYSTSNTSTFFTVSRFILWIDIQILTSKWVTFQAMCLTKFLVIGSMVSELTVFFMRNLLKMGRIYTGAITTHMIQPKQWITRADHLFVKNMIRESSLSMPTSSRVPISILRAVPLPTSSLTKASSSLQMLDRILFTHMTIVPNTSEFVKEVIG